MAGLLNELGQTVLPSVFSSLNAAGIVDTMTIKAESAASTGSGGERIKGTATNAYTNVPVAIEPEDQTMRTVAGDKPTPTGRYTLTFPTHYDNAGTPTRINVDPKIHRFVINTRGNEPAKTFRMIGQPRNDGGVVFEADCVFEG